MYIDGNHEVTCESVLKQSVLPSLNCDPQQLRLCHQIDYATSGCLVYALSKSMAARITKMFGNRSISKSYLAIIIGHPEKDEFLLDHPLAEDGAQVFRYTIRA